MQTSLNRWLLPARHTVDCFWIASNLEENGWRTEWLTKEKDALARRASSH